jgi:hypothetical protein
VHRTIIRLLALAILAGGVSLTPALRAQSDSDSHGGACNLQIARGPYGFQCTGLSFTGAMLEPVTFIGTVQADRAGVYEGYGTFNSSLGTIHTHVKGPATLSSNCFGHVDYANERILPGGSTEPLPPVSFDFVVVDGGKEILGTGVANPPGLTGDLVPRLNCRLVRNSVSERSRVGDSHDR